MQVVDDSELDNDDFEVAGEYFISGADEENALDKFHATIPIAVLDDFDISIEEAA